jgi:hypothetical protein
MIIGASASNDQFETLGKGGSEWDGGEIAKEW